MVNDLKIPGLNPQPGLNPVGDQEKLAAVAVPAIAVNRFFMVYMPGFGMRVALAEQIGNDPATMRPRGAFMIPLEQFEDYCRTGLKLVEQVQKGQH